MESTYDRLRNGIVAGEFPPGMHLVETSLAETLGVSRTPIREALSRLEQDGLVERGSRGLQVRHRSPAEILEIFEVRIVLEGTAARVAAERHTEVDRIRIQGHLSRLEAEQGAEPAVLAAINREFHRSIWQASHNRTIVDMLERLSVHLFRYPFTTYEASGRAESSLVEHRELAGAIFEHDGARAARLASDHMTVARNIRLEMWERDPSLLDERGNAVV
ncbi:MAG: GntR family transcriptional regulator [Actinomycetota bacterium]